MASNKHDQVHRPATQNLPAKPKEAKRQTKQALLLELLGRKDGATLDELTSATAWLPHTVRAAITGLRKRGHVVDRDRLEGVSRYTLGTVQE